MGPPRPVLVHCFDAAATAIGHVPRLLGAARRAPRGRDVSQRVDVVFAMGDAERLALLGPSCATIHQLARAARNLGVLETWKQIAKFTA